MKNLLSRKQNEGKEREREYIWLNESVRKQKAAER